MVVNKYVEGAKQKLADDIVLNLQQNRPKLVIRLNIPYSSIQPHSFVVSKTPKSFLSSSDYEFEQLGGTSQLLNGEKHGAYRFILIYIHGMRSLLNIQITVLLVSFICFQFVTGCFLNSCPYRRYGRTIRCSSCGPEAEGVCVSENRCCTHDECFLTTECGYVSVCPELFCKIGRNPGYCVKKGYCCTAGGCQQTAMC